MSRFENVGVFIWEKGLAQAIFGPNLYLINIPIFAGSLRAGSEWNILILPASCQQTYMTYTIAVCTVKNSC